MSQNITGNVLILQLGRPTSTSNSSLAGIVTEALNHEEIEEIYGCLNGITGLLNEQIIDMADQSQQTIRTLQHTPGSALGSSDFTLKNTEDRKRAFEVLQAHNIRFLFVIGGSSAMNNAFNFTQIAKENDYALEVIGVPNAPDNDLPVTDHCPGYGSGIKYVASTVKQLTCDLVSHGKPNSVFILELTETNSSWLIAGSALAKRRNHPEDAPHLVLMPETPFTQENFVESVQRTLVSNGHCFIVTGDSLVDKDGNFVATSIPNNPGTKPVNEFLSDCLKENFTDNVHVVELGLLPQTSVQLISKTDTEEAFKVGKDAVIGALNGKSGNMITLLRADSERYQLETDFSALDKVTTEVKAFPENWINEDHSINPQFFKYSLPLIQGEVTLSYENGLPQLATLNKQLIDKKLGAHVVNS